MNKKFKMIISLRKTALYVPVMAASLVFLCSCGNRKADIAAIQEVPGLFLEAIKGLDEDDLAACAPDLDADDWDELDDDQLEILKNISSYAEITETGDPVFDKDAGSAEMEVTISYIPIGSFLRSFDSYYVTAELISDSLEDFDYLKEKTVDLEFVRDDDGSWILTRSSAKKIYRLFASERIRWLMIADHSEDEAEEILMDYLNDIANSHNAESLPEGFDLEDYRYYDDSLHPAGKKTQDALARFAGVYMEYILTNDFEVRRDWDYSYEISGNAPSSGDLLNALNSDEYQIEFYANLIRYAKLGMNIDDLIDVQTALIYDTLAEAVPDCGPEMYVRYVSVSPYEEENGACTFHGQLISEPCDMDNSYEVTEEQYEYYITGAISLLYSNGEIDEEMRDGLLDSASLEDIGFITDTSVSVSGRPNLAVGTSEYVPSWCEDGSIVYGSSETDDYGFSMFYSKEPGWLNTVGYCIDNDSIWIANYFDRMFYPGTELVVDWWADGEQIVDSQLYVVSEFTNEIEVFTQVDEIPRHCNYEMRLWEADHCHVISYVTITR